jgi:site-specific recombinase XerD
MPAAFSPYRLRSAEGEDVRELNEFLDEQATRGLSPRSLRAYGYSLLDFWRWLDSTGRKLTEIVERDVFLDYVRFQKSAALEPAPATINHRLTAVSCLYRSVCGRELPAAIDSPSHPYHSSVASPSGYLYPARRRPRRWRVKSPRRVVVPLSRGEVRSFLESFSTWRDLALASLLLLCGLRSREAIELRLSDYHPDEALARVRGKGDKERTVPLPGEVLHFVGAYLELERPANAADTLFVSLKGKQRGEPMTPAGLRSLFRHHRRSSGIAKANPHRFRHTFGSELAAAGISLAALMRLMGHADIHTTMRYVEISPGEVWQEFRRVHASRSEDHEAESREA